MVSLAAILLTLRLTAEQWDLADLRLPLFGPRRAVLPTWLDAQQPVPAAIPLALPEQVRRRITRSGGVPQHEQSRVHDGYKPSRICHAVLGHGASPATSTSVQGSRAHTCIVTAACKL